MKAMNLFLLSRAAGGDRFSKLARELTGSAYEKQYSVHEAESLRSLTDGIASVLRKRAEEAGAMFLPGPAALMPVFQKTQKKVKHTGHM